jgi:hypothetical protein
MEIVAKQVWKDGAEKTATQFFIHTEFDDMSTRAKFAYRLLAEDGEQLINGYIEVNGEDYQEWSGSNADAYAWALGQLNLVAAE